MWLISWLISLLHFSNSQSVRVGSSYHARDGQLVRIKQIIRHEKYTLPPIDYDFALLELVEPLNYTDKVQPVGLPDADHTIEDGTLCQASGWGKTWIQKKNHIHLKITYIIQLIISHQTGYTEGPTVSRDKLRAVFLPTVNQNKCKQIYGPDAPNWVVTPRMICAGFDEGGKSICQGDSGGPLLEFNDGVPRIIGLSSWLRGCGARGYPAVFSRVSSVRDWIRDITGI